MPKQVFKLSMTTEKCNQEYICKKYIYFVKIMY